MKLERGDADPAKAANKTEFCAKLRWYRESAGFGVRELSMRTKHDGVTDLPPTTISGIEHDALPTKETLRKYLRALDLDDNKIKELEAERFHLEVQGRRVDIAEGNALRLEASQVTTRLSASEDENRRLREHIERLREEIIAKEVRTGQLAEEVERFRRDAALYSGGRANSLEDELQQLKQDITNLQRDLQHAEELRKRAEDERDWLRGYLANLGAANRSIAAALDEREGQHQDDMTAENARLHTQVEELGRALQLYQQQAAELEESSRELEHLEPTQNARNEDIFTELRLKDNEWGGEHQVTLDYEWYCTECQRGGVRDYEACPRCGYTTERNYAKTRVVRLPAKPCYGETVRFKHMGNHDEPDAPAGHVCAKVVRA